jgi:hypothetical protein
MRYTVVSDVGTASIIRAMEKTLGISLGGVGISRTT